MIKLTADIVTGKKTNRVKVSRSPGSMRAAASRGELTPARTTVPCRGPYVCISLSLGLDDLNELDQRAKAAGLERSAFVRSLIAKAGV